MLEWDSTVKKKKKPPVIKLRFEADFSDPLCLLRLKITERIVMHPLLPVYSSRLEIKGKTVLG